LAPKIQLQHTDTAHLTKPYIILPPPVGMGAISIAFAHPCVEYMYATDRQTDG